jgi:MOSC domain-containing protein YiiM
MEENLGVGGYAAMLAHGGIAAIVEAEGVVSKGDTIQALSDAGPAEPATVE